MQHSLKRISALMLLGLVCFSSCKRKREDILADVYRKYTAINEKISKYTPKRVDDLTPPGGYITGYYRDDEVKKIVSEKFSDTCRIFTEYYFDDGFLVFVLQQNYRYNRPMSYTEEMAQKYHDTAWYDDKKTRLEISRFYFDKNHLVKWVGAENKEISPGTAQFIDEESEIWGATKILLGELKEQ